MGQYCLFTIESEYGCFLLAALPPDRDFSVAEEGDAI